MKKKTGQKASGGKKSKIASASKPNLPDQAKRGSLVKLGLAGALAILVGGGSYAMYGSYQTYLDERDFEKIGNGKPTVVQIHDPNCTICNALQKETRAALSNLEDSRFQYLVANIRTAKGREFANRHNVPHITLLMFDEFGNLKNVIRGMQKEEVLTKRFEEFAS